MRDEEAAKPETPPDIRVIRDGLVALSAAYVRFTFEASAQIEQLKSKVAALEGKMK